MAKNYSKCRKYFCCTVNKGLKFFLKPSTKTLGNVENLALFCKILLLDFMHANVNITNTVKALSRERLCHYVKTSYGIHPVSYPMC
jgi:hypothetical protein